MQTQETVRILIPALAVVFDRTGGHLITLRAAAVIEEARLEADEYVYRLPGGRVYSVPAAVVTVLPAAEEEADDLADEFCPGCYEHHGRCRCN